jgi:hypothetical protein
MAILVGNTRTRKRVLCATIIRILLDFQYFSVSVELSLSHIVASRSSPDRQFCDGETSRSTHYALKCRIISPPQTQEVMLKSVLSWISY